MPTVWFIRHAESEANAGLPTTYPASIKLTPQGVEQAKRIAQFIKRQPSLIVIPSAYERAKQTALPTLERFPGVSCEEWAVQEFTYLAQTDALTTSNERLPQVEAFWKRYDPEYADAEDTESFADLIVRAQQVIAKLRQSREDFIVVFSHEQFIRAILWLLLKGRADSEPELCSNCMKSFRYFLKSFSMPNGAILPMQLQDNNETWFSSMITSHLQEALPSH